MGKWVLVPVEATETMEEAWAAGNHSETAADDWSAMLAFAPNPADDEELVDAVAAFLLSRDRSSCECHGCSLERRRNARAVLTFLNGGGDATG